MNKKLLILVSLSLILILVFFTACIKPTNEGDAEDHSQEINDLINENEEFELEDEKPLSKDSEEVLDTWEETETINNPDGAEDGQYTSTQSWETTREYYSALNHPDKYVLYNVNADVLWPGNLIQGESIETGALNPIPISGANRTPLTIFMSIVTGSGGAISETIDNPSGSTVFQSMNNIVSQHYGETASAFNLEISEVHNLNQVTFNLNAGYSQPGTDISGAFNFNWSEKKERVMVKFTQQYYSMAIDNPQDAASLFEKGVTADDLAPYTGDGNPMTYIASVTYGRMLVYVYESTNTNFDLEASLNIAIQAIGQGGGGGAEIAYQNVMNNSNVKVFSYGGSAADALAVATNFNNLEDYLVNGGELSAESPGAPISYVIRYLKNANIVRMNNTLEYSVDQSYPVGDPILVPTETTFKFYFDKARLVHHYDGTWGGNEEGQLGFKVGKFEDGAKHWIYNSAEVYDWDFTDDKIDEGDDILLERPVPTYGEFTVENIKNNRIIVNMFGYEIDSTNQNFSEDKDFIFEWDAINNEWNWVLDGSYWTDSNDDIIAQDSWDEIFFYAETGDDPEHMLVGLDLDITLNGQTRELVRFTE
jgi:hypothetical protein